MFSIQINVTIKYVNIIFVFIEIKSHSLNRFPLNVRKILTETHLFQFDVRNEAALCFYYFS